MIEGTDPKLKDTYVISSARSDHIGYSQTGGGNPPSPSGCRRRSPAAMPPSRKPAGIEATTRRLAEPEQAAADAAPAPAEPHAVRRA